MDVQNKLETSKTCPKKNKKKRLSEPRKQTKNPPLDTFFLCVSFGFFRHFETFFETFWSRSPLHFCDRMDVEKKLKGPPFKVFRHCDTVQNSQFFFFLQKILNASQWSPLFSIFCHKLEFQKAQRVPSVTILKTLRFLSLRYSAGFGRSRLSSIHKIFALD